MKLKRKVLIGMSVMLASSMILTACGKGDVDKAVEDVKQEGENITDKAEEKGEELTDKAKSDNVIVDTVVDVEEIIAKNFKKVELKDFKIETELENADRLYIADLYLYLDVEDKDEAEKLIDAYSEVLFKELYEKREYTETTLQWTTPNHDEENQIIKEDYKG